jgi:hypothetical protein
MDYVSATACLCNRTGETQGEMVPHPVLFCSYQVSVTGRKPGDD